MTTRQAIYEVADSLGWDKQSTKNLGLMLWALFRYYADRAEHDICANSANSSNSPGV
jgi:hypothetical protein